MLTYSFASFLFVRTLLVRHYRVYYPVRIHLIQHMVSAMQRLGFTANVSDESTALGRVVQRLDTSIHLTNLYPADKYKRNQLDYPLDQNLSRG